jgi:G3E family GTPase
VLNLEESKKAYIFTGFLGSGKTTSMINTVNQYFQDKKVAVIVNEFGEVSIDGKILSSSLGKDVLELSEGCICCVLYDELNKVLSDLSQSYDFEYLFIETSGLSEPFPIYSALDSMGYIFESIICIIDSKNYKKHLTEDVFKYQIGSSNIIALNKIDLVEPDQIPEIEKEISQLKRQYNLRNFLTGQELIPKYEIIKTTYGQLPEYVFKSLNEYIFNRFDPSLFEDRHFHGSYKQDVVVYPNDTLTYQQFVKIVENFPPNLIRSKGIIKLKDINNPLIFNYSYGNYSFYDYKGNIEEGKLVNIYIERLSIST